MTRIERIGNCTLYLGEMLELLPTLPKSTHIICDPPYEDELHEGAAEERIKRNDGGRQHGDLGFEGVNALRPDFARVMREHSAGWLLAFCLAEGVARWHDVLKPVGAKWDTTLVWIKPDAMPRFNGQGAARGFENCISCWCGKGHRSWNGGGKRGVYTHNVNTNRQGEHPTEKPVPLMVDLILDFTQPGDTICDPFMGSGTTGIAAQRTGRKFVGIERDPKWFDLACRRITDEVEKGEPDERFSQRKIRGQSSLDL